jgi:hypothetical protein
MGDAENGLSPVMLNAATELEHRIIRGRQIIARQRELVAKLGNVLPISVTLLETFEKTLSLFEKTQAAFLRSDALTDEAIQTVHSDKTVVAAPIPTCVDLADAARSKVEYEEQMSAARHIMEILCGGGYHCELDRETSH